MMDKNGKKIYAVDFDGTIALTEYPRIIGPNGPVVDFLLRAQGRGDKWVLWTCRCGDALEDALAWLSGNGLHPDSVNGNIPGMIEFFSGDPRKVFADFYIDDRNAGGLRLPPDCGGGADPSAKRKAKFTPGPWVLRHSPNRFGVRLYDICAGEDASICIVDGRSNRKNRANALLMKESPSMYWMLARFVFRAREWASAADASTRAGMISLADEAEEILRRADGDSGAGNA